MGVAGYEMDQPELHQLAAKFLRRPAEASEIGLRRDLNQCPLFDPAGQRRKPPLQQAVSLGMRDYGYDPSTSQRGEDFLRVMENPHV